MKSNLSTNQITGLIDCSKRTALLLMAAIWAMAGLLGCAQRNESQADDGEEGYPLLGVVRSVDESAGEMTVDHEEIPGFMEPMTMVFRASAGDLKNAQPGDRIRARLVRDEDGGFRLIKVWPVNEEQAEELRRVNQRLSKQAQELETGYYYGEGDALPDFALYDQYGELVTPESLEGKVFMLNYIFTRCTDAKMCPLSTSKMAQLQKLAAERGIEDLEFVSVTLDPQYDTPGVLRTYAENYGIDGSNFRFVTGPREDVDRLIKSLGVTAYRQDGTVLHSLATVLVDKGRRIVKWSSKSDWDPAEYLEAIETL